MSKSYRRKAEHGARGYFGAGSNGDFGAPHAIGV